MSPPVLISLKKRSQFLAAQKGEKQIRAGLILQAVKHEAQNNHIGFGLTMTKKIGNAVVRNRVRRRFRALAQTLLPRYGRAGYDYVLVGRYTSYARAHKELQRDLASALKAAHKNEHKNKN